MGHKGLKFYITEHIHNNPILYTLTKEYRAYRKEKRFIDAEKADKTFLLKSDKIDAIKRFDEDIDILKEILNDNNNNNNKNNKKRNLKEKIDDYVRKNNLLYTFTKDYKKDCEYREFMQKHKHAFALKPDNFDLEESIKILKMNNFESNYDFRIKK